MEFPLKPPIDRLEYTVKETATFALGWFWGSDARFGSLKGVIRTRVGYAGGSKQNPNYHNLGNHSETVQMDLDPQQVPYDELLKVFWESHSPESPSYSRQYMSIIFYLDEKQKQLALQSKEARQQRTWHRIFTEILPLSAFYLAESYHQKYYLRGMSEVMREFQKIYPKDADFVDSTAAARVNGYLAGYGSLPNLEAEIDSFGLSPSASKVLIEMVKRYEGLPVTH